MRIIGIGDNVVDYYEHQGMMYPGGNALNVPVLCKRLGANRASYIGILGTDKAGGHIFDSLQREDVDVSRVRKSIGPNGEAIVTLKDGDRVFVGSTAGVQDLLSIRLNSEDVSFIKEHDLVHTSVYSYIENELPKVPIDISFDFSTRREREYLAAVCPYITYAFLSGSDLTAKQCDTLMEQISAYGVKTIVITRGADGAMCRYEGNVYNQPAVGGTALVDTLGAGDAFIAGFLMSRVTGADDIPTALQRGAKAAAQTCGYYGAFGYPLQKASDKLSGHG